jgi:ankyrin repeat protein
MVLTTPRLSARYRVPLFLPSTSLLGSRPTSPLSPRSTLSRLTHTVSRARYDAEPAGKHLYDATTRGASPQQMSSLLSAHAHTDLDYRGVFRETPLMIAAAHSHLNAVRFLIGSGASVNAVDKFGSTCLHYAARSGSLPIVHLLLAAGADAAVINKHGKTPADAAHGHRHTRIVTLLQALAKAEDAYASLDVDHPSKLAGDHLLNEASLDVVDVIRGVNPDVELTMNTLTPLEDYRCLSLHE